MPLDEGENKPRDMSRILKLDEKSLGVLEGWEKEGVTKELEEEEEG